MSKVGVCEWCLPVWGPDSAYFAKDAGFQGLQLADLRGYYWGFPMNNRLIQERYRAASAETGVELQSMHLMALSHCSGMISAPQSGRGELAKLSVDKGIEACAALEIPVVNISCGFNDEETFGNLIENLRYAVNIASDKGIRVVFESSKPVPVLQRLFEAVPGLLFNYDIANSFMGDKDYQLPRAFLSLIDHVHIKDYKKDPNTGKNVPCFAGEGIFAIREGIRNLKALGYDGWYHSEQAYIEYALPEDIRFGRSFSFPTEEPTISDVRRPTSFGVGDDLSEVISEDCARIRSLVQAL